MSGRIDRVKLHITKVDVGGGGGGIPLYLILRIPIEFPLTPVIQALVGHEEMQAAKKFNQTNKQIL